MKKLVMFLVCALLSPVNQFPSALEECSGYWQNVELIFDQKLEVEKNTIDCAIHNYMRNLNLGCEVTRAREGWLVRLEPTEPFYYDIVSFLIPYSPEPHAQFLGLRLGNLLFLNGKVPFAITWGKLTLKPGLFQSGEVIEGKFAVGGEHAMRGTFRGVIS